MIVSTHNKSYDAADQSPHKSAILETPMAHDGAASKWEDDGGNAKNPYPSKVAFENPTWSLRSLRALLEAILQTNSPNAERTLKHAASSRPDDLDTWDLN